MELVNSIMLALALKCCFEKAPLLKNLISDLLVVVQKTVGQTGEIFIVTRSGNF